MPQRESGLPVKKEGVFDIATGPNFALVSGGAARPCRGRPGTVSVAPWKVTTHLRLKQPHSRRPHPLATPCTVERALPRTRTSCGVTPTRTPASQWAHPLRKAKRSPSQEQVCHSPTRTHGPCLPPSASPKAPLRGRRVAKGVLRFWLPTRSLAAIWSTAWHHSGYAHVPQLPFGQRTHVPQLYNERMCLNCTTNACASIVQRTHDAKKHTSTPRSHEGCKPGSSGAGSPPLLAKPVRLSVVRRRVPWHT